MDTKSGAPRADLKASFALEERQGVFQGDFMHQTKALHPAAQARRIPILRHVVKQEVRGFALAFEGHGRAPSAVLAATESSPFGITSCVNCGRCILRSVSN